MRRKRSSAMPLQFLKGALLIILIAAALLGGLVLAGVIKWKGSVSFTSLIPGNSKHATDAKSPNPESKPEAAAAATATASPQKEQQPDKNKAIESVQPEDSSGKPQDTKEAPAVSEQVFGRAQSIVPVTANERVWLEQLGTVKIDADRMFSFDAWYADVVKSKNPEVQEPDASHIAGLLFEAAVRAGLRVGERYTHQDLPDYASPGFDVAFSTQSKDLTLYNTLDCPVAIAVTYNGAIAAVSLKETPKGKGNWKEPKISVTKETITPEKMVLADNKAVGETKLDNGKNGLLVKVYSDQAKSEDGLLIHKDFYAPHPVIVARSTSTDKSR